jgi:hypothetical protein
MYEYVSKLAIQSAAFFAWSDIIDHEDEMFGNIVLT